MLNTLHILTHLILLSTLGGKCNDCSHLTDEETEERRLRHLPNVLQLIDELSLAPEVMILN